MGAKRRKQLGLNVRQKAFVEFFRGNGGNATQAARSAGYAGDDRTLAVVGSKLLTVAKVAAAIKKPAEKASEKRIATAQQIQALWTEVLNSPRSRMADRLKASELLAKTQGQFVKKVENTGKVVVEVRRGDTAPAALQGPKNEEDEG